MIYIRIANRISVRECLKYERAIHEGNSFTSCQNCVVWVEGYIQHGAAVGSRVEIVANRGGVHVVLRTAQRDRTFIVRGDTGMSSAAWSGAAELTRRRSHGKVRAREQHQTVADALGKDEAAEREVGTRCYRGSPLQDSTCTSLFRA